MVTTGEYAVASSELDHPLARRVSRVRPAALGSLLLRTFVSTDRVIVVDDGIRLHVQPHSDLGGELLRAGSYEPETRALLREFVRAGDVFLDVGANEGVVSVAAAVLGAKVVAVEPQARLGSVIAVNAALNGVVLEYHRGALGGPPGTTQDLNVYPWVNSGASSMARRYRFSRRTETVEFLDPLNLVDADSRLGVIKVDVEGFEPEVVESLVPLLQRQHADVLLIDYHESILQSRGMTRGPTDRILRDLGYDGRDLGVYTVYRR